MSEKRRRRVLSMLVGAIFFSLSWIKEAQSTEPLDCGNDQYLIRIPVSLSSNQITNVLFYGLEWKRTSEEFILVEKLDVAYLNWPKKVVKIEKKTGASQFQLDAKGSQGWLWIGDKKYKVECHWMR